MLISGRARGRAPLRKAFLLIFLSVREILLIRSTHIAAELIRREPDGSWPANSAPIAEEAPLVLEGLDFSRPLNAVYEGTRFILAGG